MSIINKLKVMLEERRLWKGYKDWYANTKFLGCLLGIRPIFMSFEEYKERVKNNKETLDPYWNKQANARLSIVVTDEHKV